MKARLLRRFGRKNEHFIEDAMNEAIHRLWNNVSKYDARKGSLNRYIEAIARNCTIAQLRGQALRQLKFVSDDELESIRCDESVSAAGSHNNPLLADLMACVAELPRMQQHIVLADLRSDGSAATESLAADLNTSASAIWTARSKAHKRLEHCLRSKGYAL